MEAPGPTTEERLARVLGNAKLLGTCWRMGWIEDLDVDPDLFALRIGACREHMNWDYWCRDQHR